MHVEDLGSVATFTSENTGYTFLGTRFSSSVHTVMRIIKLKLFPVPVRLHSGNGKLIFVIISPFFAIFKNVVHSLVSHQAPNYAQSS